MAEPGWGGPGKDRPQGLRLPHWTTKGAEVHSAVWLSQQREKAETGEEGPLFVLEFLGTHCHPPLDLAAGHHSSPESHPRGGSHDPGLYNLPVTEQLEPKASEDESAAPVANRTKRLEFHHF